MLTNVFLGQDVGNLYTRSGSGTETEPYVFTKASGYAVTGTDYYYTLDNGESYNKATNIAYAAFETATLYTDPSATTPKTDTTPQDGQAYYDAEGKYCVILPQQTQPATNSYLYIIDEITMVPCDDGDKAVEGMTYFDKYSDKFDDEGNAVYFRDRKGFTKLIEEE